MSRRAGISMPAVFDRAAEAAELAGWAVTQCRGSRHISWKPPRSRTIVITASTPSDHRTVRNDLSLLRRAGLEF